MKTVFWNKEHVILSEQFIHMNTNSRVSPCILEDTVQCLHQRLYYYGTGFIISFALLFFSPETKT